MERLSRADYEEVSIGTPVLNDGSSERSDTNRSLDDNEVVLIYDGEVPAFVERQLELLYQSLFTTIARIEIYSSREGASTYVVRKGDKIVTIFLFLRKRNHVTVLNQQVVIDGEEVKRFASHIFSRYPTVSLISFYAIETDIRNTRFPVQIEDCLEDIVLKLPTTEEAYLGKLGKNTGSSIKRNKKKILRDFPSLRVEILSRDTVSEEQIRTIINFSHARMAVKKETCYHNEASTQQLIRLVRKYGSVFIATIDSRICAGVITHRVGDNCFLHVIAHDPQYDQYGLGKLCCYQSICEAIAQGAAEYHFGYGRRAYKYRLGGAHQELYRVEIYRSKLLLAANIGHFIKIRALTKRRQFKLWLARVDCGEEQVHPDVVRMLNILRKLKRTICSIKR